MGQYLRQDGYQLISPSFRKTKVLRVCLASRAVPWSPRGAVLVQNRVQDSPGGARRSLAWAARPAPPFAGDRHPAFLAHRGGLGSPGCALGSAPGTAGAAAAPGRRRQQVGWLRRGAPRRGWLLFPRHRRPPLSRPARRIALLSPRSRGRRAVGSRGLRSRSAVPGSGGWVRPPFGLGYPAGDRATAAASVRGATGEGRALGLPAPSGAAPRGPEVFPESTGSSPAPSNGGGAPVATGAAMPVWLREYSWRQTGSAVYLSLPLRGVRVTPANIFCTDQYLKVGRPRSAASLVSRAFCRAVSPP